MSLLYGTPFSHIPLECLWEYRFLPKTVFTIAIVVLRKKTLDFLENEYELLEIS